MGVGGTANDGRFRKKPTALDEPFREASPSIPPARPTEPKTPAPAARAGNRALRRANHRASKRQRAANPAHKQEARMSTSAAGLAGAWKVRLHIVYAYESSTVRS